MTSPILDEPRQQLNPSLIRPESRRLHCFVVDDDADVRRFMAFSLQRSGLDAQDYRSIEEMDTALSQEHPDLIFLDVWLDGSDAVDAIRVLERHRYEGYVQLISGRDATMVENVRRLGKGRQLHMLPVLQKPFRPAEVRNIVQKVNSGYAKAQDSHRRSELQLDWLPAAKVALSEALEQGWVELWYQPKLDIQRNRVAGAEGLVRVRHPVHGLILPGAFLPEAEEASIVALTELVIIKALRDWHHMSHSEHVMRLAVNAPVSALSQVNIPELIREHAPTTPRWPGLIIEVTENEVIQDILLAQEIATQLSLYNVSLALDDFGAGYSSFARLRALPFHELKLDRSFVKNCATDRTNEGISKTIIDLAHRLGILAVAEGVESGSDLLSLYQMGCDIAQGFHLAPPMTLEQLVWTLNPGNKAPSSFRRAAGMMDGQSGG
jgi:EAL domain-containing protein (putative c-di-GMP-specific phosphodiesterase class I)/FixJ family two-component response regulator